jgi:hypothetical protein
MSEHSRTALTRRGFLRTGALAAATAPLLTRAPLAAAQTRTTKVLDFETGADVARAEQEDEVVYDGHDGEAGIGVLLDSFKKDFPKIKTSACKSLALIVSNATSTFICLLYSAT